MYIKMKHRIAFMVMVVAMMIFTLVVCTSAADNKLEMSVESLDSAGASIGADAFVKENDEITVNVKADKNPGFVSLGLILSYDPEVFQLIEQAPTYTVDYPKADELTLNGFTYGSGSILYRVSFFNENYTGTGVLFTFKFKVIGTADNAVSEIKVSQFNDEIFDENGEDVSTSFTNSKVNIHNKHTEKVHDEIPATCYSEGFSKWIECDICGDVLEEKKSTGWLDHKLEETAAEIKATCMQAGQTKGEKCTNPGCDYVKTSEPIEKLPHNLINVDAKNPTCSEMGWASYTKCDNEGCTYRDGYTEKEPLNHKDMIVTVPGKAATATETGLTDGQQCYNCQTWIQPQEVIPATGEVEEGGFPWVVVIIIVVVVAVAAVVVVYFFVVKKKNYNSDSMYEDDDEV